MAVIPDILPSIDLTASVTLSFHGTKSESSNRILPRANRAGHRVEVQPGEFVASLVSEHAPKLDVQVFDKGERMVTIAIVDADVPNLEKDGFDFRCQFLATNVMVSPTETTIRLSQLNGTEQVLLPWLAPVAGKGNPYHRVAVLVLEQPEGKVNAAKALEKVHRDGFVLRSFADRHALKAVGGSLFRVEHDEWMDEIMARNGYEDLVGVELKRKRIDPLPYKKKDGARYRAG
jgi:large subunit ribosomal protein L35